MNSIRLPHEHLVILCLVVFAFSSCAYQQLPPPPGDAQANAPASTATYTVEELASVPSLFNARQLPDGGIVYVSDQSGDYELWVRPASGQPEQLTTLRQLVVNPRVAPDGASVVFGSDFGGNERYDLYRLDLKSRKIEPLVATKDISETGHRFSPDGKWLAYEADPEIQFRPQLYMRELATGTEQQLTKGAVPAYAPVWSHDGQQLAAVRTGDDQHGDLLIVSVADARVMEIKPPSDGHILRPVEFSPDNRQLLARTKNAEGFEQLALVNLAGGSVKRISTPRWDVGEATWHDAAGIFFTRNVSGRYGLYHLPTPDAAPTELIAPRGVVSDLDVNKDGTKLSFVRADATQPADLYSHDLKSRQTAQLTRSLPAKIDPARLSAAEPFKVSSFDGTPIEGLLYRPKSGGTRQPYPAVALIHGGPNGQSVEDFSPMTQALAQSGFVVVEPNYRGSTGYGKKFEDLNNKDWGGGDRRDVRAVLEHFVREGLIDRRRIGITGGSYGGYMTLIALTKDPDFYAAGADSYGMHDLAEDYNLTKDRFGLWYETEMGTPEKSPELFADRSPISFLKDLKAPLIVFQGANDTNVPQAESDKMVSELKKMGRKVEYIVYRDEGHGFTRRPNRIDNMRRTTDFFREHMK
ncbi:MAG: prolyl oligopeptidase family serine peptidase [Pyrinomonadaceae bacterium]